MTTTSIEQITVNINDRLIGLDLGRHPNELYDPIYYILKLGGKRLRPALCVMACELFSDNSEKAYGPSLAVEIFHNFTLVHDDIMDKAPVRRGRATVHEKWNENIAILSGDVMLVKAYDQLLHLEAELLGKALKAFNRCAVEVCEGQQFDMNFETQDSIQIPDYIDMIRLKTAVLLGFSLRLGAWIGGATDEDADLLDSFGQKIGTAFQIQDDILDLYGDPEKFGKQVGGDVIANKKTLLLLIAQQMVEGSDKEELQSWLSKETFDADEKVREVRRIFDSADVKSEAKSYMIKHFDEAIAVLDTVAIADERKLVLKQFGEFLIERDY